MPGLNLEAINDMFTYHAPTQEQLPKYEAIREAARLFGTVILGNTPPSADQTATIRLLRQTVMSANQSIATGGKY